jgi:hypothetical protein
VQEDAQSWYFRGVPLGLETLPGISGAGRGLEAKRSTGETSLARSVVVVP